MNTLEVTSAWGEMPVGLKDSSLASGKSLSRSLRIDLSLLWVTWKSIKPTVMNKPIYLSLNTFSSWNLEALQV